MMFDPGTYWAVPVQWGAAETDNEKRTPFFWLECSVTNILSNGAWVPVAPANRTVRLYLSDASYPYTKEKLTTLGFNGDFADPEISNEAKGGIQLACGHEEYEGKTRERWNLLYEGGSEKKAPSNETIRRLNAKWQAEQPKTAGNAPPPPPAPPTGDNIPFDVGEETPDA